jgi:hypothetical protein
MGRPSPVDDARWRAEAKRAVLGDDEWQYVSARMSPDRSHLIARYVFWSTATRITVTLPRDLVRTVRARVAAIRRQLRIGKPHAEWSTEAFRAVRDDAEWACITAGADADRSTVFAVYEERLSAKRRRVTLRPDEHRTVSARLAEIYRQLGIGARARTTAPRRR